MSRTVNQARLNLADVMQETAVAATVVMAKALDPRTTALSDDRLKDLEDQLFHALSAVKGYRVHVNPLHIKGQRA